MYETVNMKLPKLIILLSEFFLHIIQTIDYGDCHLVQDNVHWHNKAVCI